MKIRWIQFVDNERVHVMLRPSWLGRTLLRAPAYLLVDLKWDGYRWVSAVTERWLSHMANGGRIQAALEFQPRHDDGVPPAWATYVNERAS